VVPIEYILQREIAMYNKLASNATMAERKPISLSSQMRVNEWIHDFIRSEYVAMWIAEKTQDFWNDPERAETVL
jgi:hypothetical protein